MTNFRRLHESGTVEGDFIVQFGDRQGHGKVFATVWRSVEVEAPNWHKTIDAGSVGTEYKYSKDFNPAVIRPDEVVADVRALLLAKASN